MNFSCGDSRCTHGWYYWNGSSYPCTRCKELAEERERRAKPAYTHDCSMCEFMGTSESAAVNGGAKVDHYYCKEGHAIVARRSETDSDYSSMEVGLAAVVLPQVNGQFVLHTTMQLFQAREYDRVMNDLS